MLKLLYLIPRLLIISVSTVLAVYLILLSSPDGEQVNLHERWFEYGKASFPVSRSTDQPALNFSLLSPRELDENGEPFFWITESGDVIAISNFSNITQSAYLSFELANNPCKIKRELVISTGTSQIIYSIPKNGSLQSEFPIKIDGGKTEFFALTPLPGESCSISQNDNRKFVSLISDIGIKYTE